MKKELPPVAPSRIALPFTRSVWLVRERWVLLPLAVSAAPEAMTVIPAPEMVELLPQSTVPLTVTVPALARIELVSSSLVAAANGVAPAVLKVPPLIRTVPAPLKLGP